MRGFARARSRDARSSARTAEGARVGRSRARWWAVLFAAAAVGLYVGLPRLAGLDETWGLLRTGDPWWLAAALGFELLSYGAYVVAFRAIFAGDGSRLDWWASYEITMAGVAATRLFATAGAGGIALTAWALRHAGMGRRELASRLTTFYVVLYAVFMLSLVLVGAGLRTGVLAGPAPFGVTVVPAAFAALVIAAALTLALVSPTAGDHPPDGEGPRERWRTRLAAAGGAVSAGVRGALTLVGRRDVALLGAFAWWAFDVAVLWACLHAFGEPPAPAVVVMAYFAGMLGNLLPLPGGIGGVEGGMIGALIAFGVAGGLAIVAVLSYRAFAFWLPTIPGLVAYLRLRRRVSAWDAARPAAGR
jgi:uncharacterized membrane protein YbhN (UPF0104 family)